MKILFLTPRDSRRNLGGVEGHVRILTEELERRGNEVNELSLDQTDKSYKDYKNYKDQDNTSIASLDSSTRRKLLARNDVFFKFRAWKYLWDRRELLRWADVIHVHDVFWWYAPFAVINKGLALLQRQGQALVNVTFHGWEGVCPPTRSAVWQKRLAQKLSQGTIGVGSFYEKWYGVRPERIVWGVNSIVNKGPAFRPAKGRALRKIVFLGRMERVNGVEIVVEALEKLANRQIYKYTNIQIDKLRQCVPRIIFVGDGSYRKQAEKFGKVTGMVKNPQKYLVSADLVIASSYMSILEAAAIGKPIIAIGNNELKMDYLNCHPLRKWIRVCRNPEGLIREIGGIRGIRRELELARQWAEKQTPIRLADVYEELWKKYSLSFRT